MCECSFCKTFHKYKDRKCLPVEKALEQMKSYAKEHKVRLDRKEREEIKRLEKDRADLKITGVCLCPECLFCLSYVVAN